MKEMQFKKGQMLSYGTNGICIVDDIKTMKITLDSKPEPYYILKLKRDAQSTVSVPVANKMLTSKMREPMSKDQINTMLHSAKERRMVWTSDRRSRNDRFREIMVDGVSTDLLRMIMCIYERKNKLYKEGKKLPVTDANTLKNAVRLFEEEVAYVFEMPEEDVAPYVKKTMGIRYDGHTI